MRALPLRSVIRFELTRWLRARRTWVGLLLFTGILILGHVLAARPGFMDPGSDRFFFLAFVGYLGFALRLGIADDRLSRSQEFLVLNFQPRPAYVAGKVITYLSSVALSVGAFVTIATVVSLGDAPYAAFHSVQFGLLAIVLLPFFFLGETFVDTRHPGLLVLLLLFLGIIVPAVAGAEGLLTRVLGLESQPLVFSSLTPLIGRTPAALVVVALLYPLCARNIPGDVTPP